MKDKRKTKEGRKKDERRTKEGQNRRDSNTNIRSNAPPPHHQPNRSSYLHNDVPHRTNNIRQSARVPPVQDMVEHGHQHPQPSPNTQDPVALQAGQHVQRHRHDVLHGRWEMVLQRQGTTCHADCGDQDRPFSVQLQQFRDGRPHGLHKEGGEFVNVVGQRARWFFVVRAFWSLGGRKKKVEEY